MPEDNTLHYFRNSGAGHLIEVMHIRWRDYQIIERIARIGLKAAADQAGTSVRRAKN